MWVIAKVIGRKRKFLEVECSEPWDSDDRDGGIEEGEWICEI